MKRGQDISVRLPGLYLIHHNKPAMRVRRYARPEHLLFIPLQGEIDCAVGRQAHPCGPGRMLYVPSGVEHGLAASERSGERLIAMIDEDVWRDGGGGTQGVTVMAASQLVKELIFYLLLHPDVKHPRALALALVATLSESLAAAALSGPLETVHFEAKVRDARVAKALVLLQASLGDAVSVQAVAAHAGLSVRNMNRLFLEELGLTPRQVLIQMRIGRARELLAEGAPVTQVALECGYRSLSRFIAAFRQITGQLPSDFRRFGRK